VILAEGAGAICLRRAGDDESGVKLEAVTDSHTYSRGTTRDEACARMRNELLASGQADLLCDGTTGEERQDTDQGGGPPVGQPAETVTWALRVQRKSSEHGWVYLVSVKIETRICLKNISQPPEIQGEFVHT